MGDARSKLLELDNSANSLKSLLESLSLCLWKSLLNGAGSAINEFLSLLQTKTASLLNGLNDLKLLSTSLLEDNVKVGLLLNSGSLSCGSSSNSNSCSSRLNTILFLQNLCEFVYFLNGEVNQLLCKNFQICHNCNFLILLIY